MKVIGRCGESKGTSCDCDDGVTIKRPLINVDQLRIMRCSSFVANVLMNCLKFLIFLTIPYLMS